MFPRQLPLYSYVISLMVSLCFVCACVRVCPHIYSICQILSFHLSEDLQTLVNISLLHDWDGTSWCYGKYIEIRWKELAGTFLLRTQCMSLPSMLLKLVSCEVQLNFESYIAILFIYVAYVIRESLPM